MYFVASAVLHLPVFQYDKYRYDGILYMTNYLENSEPQPPKNDHSLIASVVFLPDLSGYVPACLIHLCYMKFTFVNGVKLNFVI